MNKQKNKILSLVFNVFLALVLTFLVFITLNSL